MKGKRISQFLAALEWIGRWLVFPAVAALLIYVGMKAGGLL